MFLENTLFMFLKTKKRAHENYFLKQFSISKLENKLIYLFI